MKKKEVARYALIVVTVLVFFIPSYVLFTTAFKTRDDTYVTPPKWIFNPTLEPFSALFLHTNVKDYFINSVVISTISTAITLLIAIPAAYSFSRLTFKGRKDLFFAILSSKMFPLSAVIIPFYILYTNIGLYDTHIGLIFIYSITNIPFALWLMTSFIQEIPFVLEESAMIDGCSRSKAFQKVILPLAIPGIAVTTIFTVIFCWNEFLLANILTTSTAMTMPVGLNVLNSAFAAQQNWPMMAALELIMVIPIIIVTVLFQRFIVRGLTFGAVKG